MYCVCVYMTLSSRVAGAAHWIGGKRNANRSYFLPRAYMFRKFDQISYCFVSFRAARIIHGKI